ncbi:hypothetical protein Emed_002055 [Eimeria media]
MGDPPRLQRQQLQEQLQQQELLRLQQQQLQQQELLQDHLKQQLQQEQRHLRHEQQRLEQDRQLLQQQQHQQQHVLLDEVYAQHYNNSSSSSTENSKLAGCICLFLLGYCGQPILVDFCRLQGVASASTFIFLLPHYLGMILAGSLPISAQANTPEGKAQLRNPRLWRRVLRLSLIDLAHQLLEKGTSASLGAAAGPGVVRIWGVYPPEQHLHRVDSRPLGSHPWQVRQQQLQQHNSSSKSSAAAKQQQQKQQLLYLHVFVALLRQFSPLQVFSLCLIVVGVSIKVIISSSASAATAATPASAALAAAASAASAAAASAAAAAEKAAAAQIAAERSLETPDAIKPFKLLLLLLVLLLLQASNFTINFSSEESLGMLLSLAAAILQGLTFVLNERFMEDRKEPVTGLNLVFMMGYNSAVAAVAAAEAAAAAAVAAAAVAHLFFVSRRTISSLILIMWTCVWTLPQLDALVLSRVRAQGGDLKTISLLLSLLLLCGALHSATMWYIILRLGAVTSGALKGCKAAAVIALSHILFCSVQETQCVDLRKGVAAVVCIGALPLKGHRQGPIAFRSPLQHQQQQLLLQQQQLQQQRCVRVIGAECFLIATNSIAGLRGHIKPKVAPLLQQQQRQQQQQQGCQVRCLRCSCS